mgnify:FL=1
MNTENKTLNKLEKIKAIAMAFCASGILTMGATYFKPQTEYHVPRILYPVFEIFGNVGLAIGMILLGIILIYFAYKKYKENLGKTGFFIASILFSIILFAIIIVFFDKDKSQKPTLTEQLEESKKANDKLLNEITAMEKPKFSNAEVEAYILKLENIIAKCKKNESTEFHQKMQAEMQQNQMDYMKYRNLLTNKSDQEKLDKYNAKLSIEFGEILHNQ